MSGTLIDAEQVHTTATEAAMNRREAEHPLSCCI